MLTRTCIKSANVFSWGIFRAAWKGSGSGQELSAEVIRAAGTPLFNQSFVLNILAFIFAPIGAFFHWLFVWHYHYKHSVSKKFGESYQKTTDTNKCSLLPFKIVAIRYNTCLTTFVQLPETISKGLLWNRSQNCCHTTFDGIRVCETFTFDGRLQAGKQQEILRNQIRWLRRVIKHSYHLLGQELAHTDRTVCRGIIVEQHAFSSPVQLWPNPPDKL